MAQEENSRRGFIQRSAALGSAAAAPFISKSGFAQGKDDILRVGLIGCGGRGSGAAMQALSADPGARLVAMCDIFPDRLKASVTRLKKGKGDKVQVDAAHQFTGFDGYRKLIDAVDVVLLASPPGFRPLHLAACAEAGKHVFCEKPVAVDMPGLNSVLASAKILKSKNKSLVSGLCWRYEKGIQETIKRVQDGAIGRIVSIEATTMGGGLWNRPMTDGMSEMERQIRNWNKWQWLCGDIYLESHIHSLDMAAWALGDIFPVSAWGMGGRQVLNDPDIGNIFDHHHARFEFENGIVMTSYSRNQLRTMSHYDVHLIGTEGEAWTRTKRIIGKDGTWMHRGRVPNMYQEEHDRLFESIRNETPTDNSHYMCNSNKIGLLGRAAIYTGQPVTAKKLEASTQVLGPDVYEWGDHKPQPVPMPGITQLT
ncbi:MAG: myo-inositol 2-dehydrogenase/D-chiro-inositol 1-dehydrogenase [Rhodothermales bacterium]|jgi:myo-inositol 2-dehydrogenase/D-chiro-inositol 1-dehydrogenase